MSAAAVRAVHNLSPHSRAPIPRRARRAPTARRRPLAPSNANSKGDDDPNPMGSFPEGGLAALNQDDLPAMRRACLKVATDAAKLGAAVMLDKLGADVVKTKANARDLLTEVDPEVQRIIESSVADAFPTHGFLGEESVPGGWEAGSAAIARLLDTGPDWLWVVDPIDGTRNFASGQPPFGILIAQADGGVAQSGWIYDCLSGRFCAAHRGKGAFVGGERVTAMTTGEDPPVAAISLIFMDDARREAMKAHICPHYRLVDIPYCAAEQYPRLALGENDVSIFERTLAWDHAAGVLWLNEAGGKAARPDGSPYRVDEVGRTGLLGAASPALWVELADLYARFD